MNECVNEVNRIISGNENKKNQMVLTRGMHEKEDRCIENLDWNPELKKETW